MTKRTTKTAKTPIKGKRTKQKKNKETHYQKACDYKEPKRLYEYEPFLRGPPQNKFGGHRTRRIRGVRGNTFGPASPCYVYTKEEREALERVLRDKGRLGPQHPNGSA